MRQKRAAIHTLGCRLNHAESSLIAERLADAGYVLVSSGEAADVCIINTCTVTGEADAKSRKMIRAFVRKHPEAFVAVVGCYAELAAEAIAGIPGVDLILGTQNKLDVLEYIRESKNPTPIVVRREIDTGGFTIPLCGSNVPTGRLGHRANLKIQDGCNQWCSYCVVPAARGPARSRDFDNAIAEAGSLAERGTKEIVLTGVNVGAYSSNGHTLLDVIDGLNELAGIRRIRLSSIELLAVPEGLVERMADPSHALVPFLHLPLQSGSDRILDRMGRGYKAETFRPFVQSAVEGVPDLCVGVDVLVGFPSESQTDFDDTRRVLEASPIAYAHVFKYSDRKGTVAEGMAEKVDPRVSHERSVRARWISVEKRRAFHRRYIGKCVEVLFEEKDKGCWWGYTGNYIRVAACSNVSLENAVRDVIIAADYGEYVGGELVEAGLDKDEVHGDT
jgi:threonylcarbamoyladenosine tRNA methylthiotransferase MtaB